MIRLFVGWDEREEVGSHVFTSSVIHNSSLPVSITHLNKQAVANLYGTKIEEGTNAFTLSRFLVPALCDFSGFAIFADGADMLCRGDLAELWSYKNPNFAVQCVRHKYETRHTKKYVNTRMEAENEMYDRKNWSSLMIMFCGHMAWRKATPEWLEKQSKLDVLQMRWIPDDRIGTLPLTWNWLADEFGPNHQARLVHWTCGVPGFPAYEATPHSDEWRKQLKRVNYATD